MSESTEILPLKHSPFKRWLMALNSHNITFRLMLTLFKISNITTKYFCPSQSGCRMTDQLQEVSRVFSRGNLGITQGPSIHEHNSFEDSSLDLIFVIQR